MKKLLKGYKGSQMQGPELLNLDEQRWYLVVHPTACMRVGACSRNLNHDEVRLKLYGPGLPDHTVNLKAHSVGCVARRMNAGTPC